MKRPDWKTWLENKDDCKFWYHLQNSINKEDVKLVASSLDREDIEIMGDSKELREKACYDVHKSFEKDLAEGTREGTVDFVNKIKLLLKEKT